MREVRLRCILGAIMVALVGTGCATGVSSSAAPTSRPAPDDAEAIEAIYRARLDSAQTRYTEADVRFMTRMIAHHAQAVVMAELVPDRTDSANLRTLAGRVINAQTDEIETITRWLRDRDEPVPQEHSGAAHDMSMPGMITPDQMRRLEEARGSEFDRLFLSLMIRHHAGAVEMVEELFTTDGAGQDEEVFKFASDVQVDQRTEIARMERMLESIPSGATGR